MTEVSFYHLTVSPLEKALPALLEKVLGTGKNALLMAKTDEKLDMLDDYLWAFSTIRFIPHGKKGDGYEDKQPIFLTLEEENPNDAKMLVCVESVEPKFTGDFERVIDVFDGNDETELSAARARWKQYKSNGHEVAYWQQTEKGGWEQPAA